VGFLESVGSHDYRLHRRCSQPPLVGDLGALERRTSRYIQASGRDKDEPPDPCLLGGINESRHASFVDLTDRGMVSAAESTPQRGDSRHNRVDPLTSAWQTESLG
jgi:hypothetical protein